MSRRSDTLAGYAFLGPSLVGVVGFLLVPAVATAAGGIAAIEKEPEFGRLVDAEPDDEEAEATARS
jgi:hypothetical protein